MIKLQKMISAMVIGFSLFSAAPVLAVELGGDCTSSACDTGLTCDATTKQCVGGSGSAYVTPGELLPSSVGVGTGLGTSDIRVTIARIIRVAMGLLGIVAVVIILIGGFTWMTAGGNEEKVGEAKKWIFAGIIGLAIILSAYAIASFVINNLVNATTNVGIGG